MKSRNGFVSNSSSSSFIIVFKAPECCPTCGRSSDDFLSYIEHREENYGDDTMVHDVGFEPVLKTITDGGIYYEPESEEAKKLVDRIKQIQTEHPEWCIVYMDISYHDDSLKNRINGMVTAGTAERLYVGE